MKIPGFNRDKTRMMQWLLMAVLAYALAALMASVTLYGDSGLFPRIQTVLWKCGHLTIAAYLGFALDRHAFRDTLGATSDPLLHLRRAVIIGCAMLAFGLAL